MATSVTVQYCACMGLIEILISMHFFQESEDKSVTDLYEHKCLPKLIMLSTVQ